MFNCISGIRYDNILNSRWPGCKAIFLGKVLVTMWPNNCTRSVPGYPCSFSICLSVVSLDKSIDCAWYQVPVVYYRLTPVVKAPSSFATWSHCLKLVQFLLKPSALTWSFPVCWSIMKLKSAGVFSHLAMWCDGPGLRWRRLKLAWSVHNRNFLPYN